VLRLNNYGLLEESLILDNKDTVDSSEPSKVYEYLEKFIDSGEMDIVTGYFTISTLAWLNEKFNDKISKFRFVWGDIPKSTSDKKATFDLLNVDFSIDKVLQLRRLSIQAIKFLRQEKVSVKTTEPNFCHAKLYLFKATNKSQQFYITGSSNLTDSGIGRNFANNIELNISGGGGGLDSLIHEKLVNWFNSLWNTSDRIREAKQEFIDKITLLCHDYLPKDIYIKILSEMFPVTPSLEVVEKVLKETKIYNVLYPFQQYAVESLRATLEEYNGAILADAVGLGKTYTTLILAPIL